MYTHESYEFLRLKLEQDSFECNYKGNRYLYRHHIDNDGYTHMEMYCDDGVDSSIVCRIKVPKESRMVELFLATCPFGRGDYWDIQEHIIWNE